MIRILLIIATAFALAGCQTTGLTSISGGESKVFEPPPYVVLGKTQYDQNIIDNWVEGGVAAFSWPRPKPRPPELDRPAKPKAVVAKKGKKKLISRIKERVWPAVQAAPVIPVPAAPQIVEPAPRAAVDEFLDPPNIRRVH